MWSSHMALYLMRGMQWLVELVPYLILAAAFEIWTQQKGAFIIPN